MNFDRENLIHLFAGGCGGTMGAIMTCPLEVVKTRLQSSANTILMNSMPHPAARWETSTTCSSLPNRNMSRKLSTSAFSRCQVVHLSHQFQDGQPPGGGSPKRISIWHYLRYIQKVEGTAALFRGLGPNLVGVAPSRAIYFSSYAQMKKTLLISFNIPEGTLNHMLSALWAGVTSSTLTNPIWLIKTRLQLDRSQKTGKRLSVWQCIQSVYRSGGILGFYKGITASYYGVSETVIHFVIYEHIKSEFLMKRQRNSESRSWLDMLDLMLAAATSKSIASCCCYPHEVARTRLREEGQKYKGFWQTLALVFREEGWHGLYRGLIPQIIRQVPNTAIMMLTYEAVSSHLCNRYLPHETQEYGDDDDS